MKPDYPYALTYQSYREHMAADFARLLELTTTAVTDGRSAQQVPACPEWDFGKLARHTALVYLQKAETIRTGVKPQGRWVPDEVMQLGPVEILTTCYERLCGQFDAHDPSHPAESWVAEDQTVGFWIRRLTHETSIHRYDAEDALGDARPIRPELAIDGIDEVLTVMVARGGKASESATGTVAVASGGRTWTVNLLDEQVTILRETADAPDAQLIGEPNDVLLWLWGRAPLPAHHADQPAVAELRRRLAAAT